ncbi:MAG: phosphoenolpyruvate synthase [Alphaproteobacteria bacterium]|nr:phosphoenolpyruvate synthase [Alphaproteobacteria bacterium]
MSFAFASKAESLERLARLVTKARVLPLVHFTVGEWETRRGAVLRKIKAAAWGAAPMIVRSSADGEDSEAVSLAGHFLSVPDVEPDDLVEAVERVIASYGDGSGRHRVLVQPMLARAAASGVAFTVDPNTGSPYLVVNYERDGNTSAVTGGKATAQETFYLWRDAPPPADPLLRGVAALARELMALTGREALDFEFASDAEGGLVLLQCRPMVLRAPTASPPSLSPIMARIAQKIAHANRPHPYLCGPRTVFGVMPDWNPAEIVGVRPKPLALSLYRELITDSIWAYQRSNYGYRNLRSFPILIDFHGLPYIDVRVSFNSFVPEDIPEAMAHRLVAYYIDRLIAVPSLHDKVEFEIVQSCYTFDIDRRLARLAESGFSGGEREELKQSLRRLTNRVVHRSEGLWIAELDRIAELERRRGAVLGAEMSDLDRIYWLLEDCKRHGTLPFAGLARAGFIAMQLLDSLVHVGVLAPAEKAAFMAGLDTVSNRMVQDLRALTRGAFLERYGHLRPGTYDILSPRYDEAPEAYFDWQALGAAVPDHREAPRKFTLSLDQMRAIERLIAEHGLELDVVGLFGFIEAGIRGREHAKFVFTHSLSDALVLLGRLGGQHGLSPADMAYFDIAAFKDMYGGCPDIDALLRDTIARGRARHGETLRLALPPLITHHDQVYAFHVPPTEPNFITQKTGRGQVRTPDQADALAGSILFIPCADPGYDWVFSHGIAGFVTAYGGVNSHMAIRANELEIPAAIGVGEALFRQWGAADMIEIDAANRRVQVLC